ncbi:MAG: hypothetical protein WCG06_02855, partial [Candidatus Omnitrophota bacterium]
MSVMPVINPAILNGVRLSPEQRKQAADSFKTGMDAMIALAQEQGWIDPNSTFEFNLLGFGSRAWINSLNQFNIGLNQQVLRQRVNEAREILGPSAGDGMSDTQIYRQLSQLDRQLNSDRPLTNRQLAVLENKYNALIGYVNVLNEFRMAGFTPASVSAFMNLAPTPFAMYNVRAAVAQLRMMGVSEERIGELAANASNFRDFQRLARAEASAIVNSPEARAGAALAQAGLSQVDGPGKALYDNFLANVRSNGLPSALQQLNTGIQKLAAENSPKTQAQQQKVLDGVIAGTIPMGANQAAILTAAIQSGRLSETQLFALADAIASGSVVFDGRTAAQTNINGLALALCLSIANNPKMTGEQVASFNAMWAGLSASAQAFVRETAVAQYTAGQQGLMLLINDATEAQNNPPPAEPPAAPSDSGPDDGKLPPQPLQEPPQPARPPAQVPAEPQPAQTPRTLNEVLNLNPQVMQRLNRATTPLQYQQILIQAVAAQSMEMAGTLALAFKFGMSLDQIAKVVALSPDIKSASAALMTSLSSVPLIQLASKMMTAEQIGALAQSSKNAVAFEQGVLNILAKGDEQSQNLRAVYIVAMRSGLSVDQVRSALSDITRSDPASVREAVIQLRFLVDNRSPLATFAAAIGIGMNTLLSLAAGSASTQAFEAKFLGAITQENRAVGNVVSQGLSAGLSLAQIMMAARGSLNKDDKIDVQKFSDTVARTSPVPYTPPAALIKEVAAPGAVAPNQPPVRTPTPPAIQAVTDAVTKLNERPTSANVVKLLDALSKLDWSNPISAIAASSAIPILERVAQFGQGAQKEKATDALALIKAHQPTTADTSPWKDFALTNLPQVPAYLTQAVQAFGSAIGLNKDEISTFEKVVFSLLLRLAASPGFDMEGGAASLMMAFAGNLKMIASAIAGENSALAPDLRQQLGQKLGEQIRALVAVVVQAGVQDVANPA